MSGRDITEEHDMANKHRNMTDTNAETKAALTNKQTKQHDKSDTNWSTRKPLHNLIYCFDGHHSTQ